MRGQFVSARSCNTYSRSMGLMSMKDFALDFQIDPPSIDHIRSHPGGSFVVDAVNGTVTVRTLWTKEVSKSRYSPRNDVLTVNAVVLGPFFDELIGASLRMSNLKSGSISASLHGTPLELSINSDENFVTVKLVEYVDYSEGERILGNATVPRKSFQALVRHLVEIFLSRIISENAALSVHPGVLNLQKEAQVLRKITMSLDGSSATFRSGSSCPA